MSWYMYCSGGDCARMMHMMCRYLARRRAMQKSAPSVAHVTPRCHPRRYGAHGSGRRRGGHRIAGGSAGRSCNGQTTKYRRAAAAASTTTTAGRRRRRRGRDQITDGRPDNLRQLLCSSAKRDQQVLTIAVAREELHRLWATLSFSRQK